MLYFDLFLLIIAFFLLTFGTIIVFSIMFGGLFSGPYVPTNIKTVERLIKEAKIKKNQVVYDLGCGDGRLVFAAAKKGAKAIGLEISFFVFLLAKIKQWINKHKVSLYWKDFFRHDLSDADLIFCYLLPKSMPKLQKKLEKDLKKGTKVISHAFEFPNWRVIKKIPYNKNENIGSVWIYEKP